MPNRFDWMIYGTSIALIAVACASFVVGASESVSVFDGFRFVEPDGVARHLPQSVAVTSQSGRSSLTLHYGYDCYAQALAVVLTMNYGNDTAGIGWVGMGLRFSNGTFSASMGPSDLLVSYLLPPIDDREEGREEGPLPCLVQMYLRPGTSGAPQDGQRDERPWSVYGFKMATLPHLRMAVVEMVLVPLTFLPRTFNRATVEFLLAAGDSGALTGDHCSSTSVAQHNVLARRINITFEHGIYSIAQTAHGCHYGEKADDSEKVAACTRCFPGFQGRNCSASCTCTHGACSTAVTVDSGTCSVCDSWFYGPQCKPCTCNRNNSVACFDGVSGNGGCVCAAPYGGRFCTDCDASHYGPRCENVCECVSGICKSGIGGDGRCSSCFGGVAGRYCNITCSACPSGSHCDSGVEGTGECDQGTEIPGQWTTAVLCNMNIELSNFQSGVFLTTMANALGVGVPNIVIDSIRSASVELQFHLAGLQPGTASAKYRKFFFLVDTKDPRLAALQISQASRIYLGSEAPVPTNLSNATNAPPVATWVPSIRPLRGLSDGGIVGLTLGLAVFLLFVIAAVACAMRFASNRASHEMSGPNTPISGAAGQRAPKGDSHTLLDFHPAVASDSRFPSELHRGSLGDLRHLATEKVEHVIRPDGANAREATSHDALDDDQGSVVIHEEASMASQLPSYATGTANHHHPSAPQGVPANELPPPPPPFQTLASPAAATHSPMPLIQVSDFTNVAPSRQIDNPGHADDLGDEGRSEGEGERRKKCKFCGENYSDEEVCPVEQRSHRQLKTERKLEKRAKKDARLRIAQHLSAGHMEVDSD